MKINKYIAQYLKNRLDDRKVLVIYDPDGLYEDIVMEMSNDKLTVVDGSASTIAGREAAIEIWCKLGQSDDANARMVVYLPIKKPMTDKECQQNPYQIFSLGGAEFPSGDGESYQAMCRQAAPDLAPQIDQLFAAGLPDFETVNNLIAGGANWPKLKTLLKAESAVEILASMMSPSDKQERALLADKAWLAEFRQFLTTALDCSLKTKSTKLPTIASEIWRFILFSEFVFDLPEPLPETLKNVPRAADQFKDLVYSVCDNLRGSERHQQRYMDMADKVASVIKIETFMAEVANLGRRDTFAFEERFFLKVFVDAVLTNNYEEAAEIRDQRNQSIWVRHRGERQQLWMVADRALRLLIAVEDLRDEVAGIESKAGILFDFYCESFRRVDRLHRDFEQAVADAYGELDILEKVVDTVRKKYMQVAEALQAKFTSGVKAEGWPVNDRTRQGEVFGRFVSPWLKERQKVAYFMVDALRYELAVELENELSAIFTTEIHPVCAHLPTMTSVGMASLMPEADGQVSLAKDKDGLVPQVMGQKVLVPKDRFSYLQTYYGDRVHMRDLDELVSKPKIKIPDTAQLLVVKTTDIDQFGEINPLEARRLIPRLVQKIIAGINRVKQREFHRAVVVTDHGFILFDDQQAGDRVPKPTGEWSLVKSRCLIGKGNSSEGVIVFNKNEVGIRGDFEDYAVPRSFGTFVMGSPYAHEGLSLQECILPVISVDFGKESIEPINVTIDINLTYKGGLTDKITTRRPMIEISMFSAMFEETIEFQLEAYAGKEVVGEVAASPHVNAATNLVSIQPGHAIKVPLKMEEEFHGSFEVRANDPLTQVNYSTIKLKTNYVD